MSYSSNIVTSMGTDDGRSSSKSPKHHATHLRGWRRYFYEVSWPSVLISSVLVYLAHFVDLPEYENWHYNKHNEWSFDFKEQKDEIVPFGSVLVAGVLCGLVIGLIELSIVRSGSRAHRVIFAINLVLGLLDALLISVMFTEFAKNWVTEPRPDFRSRCLGSVDAAATYKPNGDVICTGDAAVIREGRLSFPSGHSSASACIGIYTTAYIVWVVYLRPVVLPWRARKVWVSSLARLLAHSAILLCVLPLSFALFVAGSRIVDHRHSPTDVTAGALLGLMFGMIVFARVVSESNDSVAEEA